MNPECDGLNHGLNRQSQYRAAIRIVSGVAWHNDLQDQDSDTYKQLENQLKEMVSSSLHLSTTLTTTATVHHLKPRTTMSYITYLGVHSYLDI